MAAVFEFDVDTMAISSTVILSDVTATSIEFDGRRVVGANGGRQGVVQIGSMDEVVTLAVLVDQRLAAVDPTERARVLVMPNALIFGVIRLGAQRFGEPEIVERMCRRGTERDARTHLGEHGRLFEYARTKARPLQCKRCREAADAGADDADVQ